jgi:hypothetical protein
MSNNHRVGCLDMLRSRARNDEEARGSVSGVFSALLAGVLLVDIATAALFIFSVNGWSGSEVASSWRDSDLTSFKTQVWDCVLLSAARVVLLPGIATLAIRFGSQQQFQVQRRQQQPKTRSSLSKRGASDTLYSPLVGGGAEDRKEEEEEEEEEGAQQRGRGQSNDDAGARANAEAEDKDLQARKATARIRKHVFVSLLFAASTFFQLYVGLKVSVYELPGRSGGGRHTAEAILLCLSVLWVNVEVFALRTLIMEKTRQSGLFLPDVHPHPLFISKGVHLHWCDVCSTRIRDGHAWRCKLCDFDMCSACAGRKDRGTVGENLLRSDKGKRKDRELSSATYLRRALLLARKEAATFAGAFALLFAYTATNLALPNFQGRIIE